MRSTYDFRSFVGDVTGAVTSGVAVLPVGLAFGVASGLGALAGLYGTIAVGFITAVFGGTPAAVSATTAPMLAAMSVILARYAGNLAEAFTIVMLGGLLQIAFGALRLGHYITYTPYSVIAGFMSGIGVIIMTGSVLPVLGAASAAGGMLGSIRAWPDAVVDLNTDAFVVGAVTIAVCVAWPARVARVLPAYLAALIAGTAIAGIGFGDAPVIGPLPTGLPALQAPVWFPGMLVDAVQPASILALIGSINSLLSALLHDSLTRTRHNSDRELVGQGLGNIAAGLLGALPGSASPAGTAINIRAGGRTRVSGVLRSVLLLALVLGIGTLVEPVPHAVLAGILIKAGWDMIDRRFLSRIRRIRRDYVVVMLLTFVLTLFIDLVTAVAVGFIVSALARARELGSVELTSMTSVPLLDRAFLSGDEGDADADPFRARVGLVDLRGSFSVASANELTWMIGADIEDHDIAIFDFSRTTHMDDSAALAIERLIDSAAKKNTECIVMALSGAVAHTLDALDVLRRIPAEHFVGSMDEARDLAKRLLDKRDRLTRGR